MIRCGNPHNKNVYRLLISSLHNSFLYLYQQQRYSGMAMAVNLATNSSFLSTTPFPSSSVKSPFLGFSLTSSSNPSSIRLNNKPFKICCEDKSAPAPALVPSNQQWMFDCMTGPDLLNRTWYPKAKDHVNTDKPWYVVDATDKILGRLASTIAIHIRGKNLATYTPSVDMGAFVIVVNADKVAVSGKKRTQKMYRRHSGRPGGMKVETFDQLQRRIPERIIEHAVRGMLPKGRLGNSLFNHLKVYAGPDHPHEAQKPRELPIRDKRIQK